MYAIYVLHKKLHEILVIPRIVYSGHIEYIMTIEKNKRTGREAGKDHTMRMKQYEVEVYEKHSHGVWGKQHYFGMVLSSNNIANAESFALDILAGMTPNEVRERSDGRFFICSISGLRSWVPVGDGVHHKCVRLDLDKPFGYEEAEKRFTVKARVFKG